MYRLSWFVNDGIESVLMVSCVVDSAKSAIRVSHSVGALYDISVAFLLVGFEVTSVVVFNAVFVFVFRISLSKRNKLNVVKPLNTFFT